MQQWLARKRNTLFNVLFVMMEGLELEFRQIAWRKTCVLFLIDFLQLLRILTMPVFGWSARTSGLIEKFDIVYDFTLLGSMVVPRYSFFILAFVVVAFALLETIFVARIFEAGSVKQMWPVKVLRFLVVMMVTTLFSSLVKWLLIPFSCLVSEDASFSEEIHGDGTACNPFRFPEILATVPTLVVGITYIAFAFCATTFSLNVNLLSRAPRSSSTGRVEILFLANKVAATCLVLLSNMVSPTAVAAILLLISLSVFWLHVSTLPFHHQPTNMLRGGIYACNTWASLSSIIVSINDSLTLQWTLIALLPVMFLAGMWYVHSTHSNLLSSLDRMRGEWEQRRSLAGLQRTASADSTKLSPCTNHSFVPGLSHPQSSTEPAVKLNDGTNASIDIEVSQKPNAEHRRPIPQNARERFYDKTGELRRIFVSGRHALACARVLLYQRCNDDREFLEYVIDRGLEDFRDYKPLIVFRILVMSMVLSKQHLAKAEDKRIKDSGENLPIDLRYLLYCFERKNTQEMAAQNLGRQSGGQISAINLMEFNLGLATAKEAHQKALQAIKNVWRSINRLAKGTRISPPTEGPPDQGGTTLAVQGRSSGGVGGYEEVVSLLEDFTNQTREAKKEYSSLLFKYPTSVELLFAYAAFLDVCMNDPSESDAKLAQAIALQDGDGSSGGEGEAKKHVVVDDGKSATSGSSTSNDKRKTSKQFVVGWQHRIMGCESQMLTKLVFRIKIATLFLVATAMVAFFISDFVLFKGMTKSKMHRVSSLGELYTLAVVITQNARTLMLSASHHRDLYPVEKVREHALHMVERMQDEHVRLHSNVDFPEVEHYFNVKKLTTLVPTAGGWKEDRTSLWEIGNEFTTRAQLAFSTPGTELRNVTYKLSEMSDEKRNIPYLFENTFRVLVPNLEELKNLYVHEMDTIQATVDLLVAINASCNSFLVILITVLVMRGLWNVVHRMEGKELICRLMASLPRRTSKTIYQHYRKAEVALQELEDEDAERKALVDGDGDGAEGGDWECKASHRDNLPPSPAPGPYEISTGAGSTGQHSRDTAAAGMTSKYDVLQAKGRPGNVNILGNPRLPSTGACAGAVPLSNDAAVSSSGSDEKQANRAPFQMPSTPQRGGSKFPPANISQSSVAAAARDKIPLAGVEGSARRATPVVLALTTENLECVYRQTDLERKKTGPESDDASSLSPMVEVEDGLAEGAAETDLWSLAGTGFEHAESVLVRRPRAVAKASLSTAEGGGQEMHQEAVEDRKQMPGGGQEEVVGAGVLLEPRLVKEIRAKKLGPGVAETADVDQVQRDNKVDAGGEVQEAALSGPCTIKVASEEHGRRPQRKVSSAESCESESEPLPLGSPLAGSILRPSAAAAGSVRATFHKPFVSFKQGRPSSRGNSLRNLLHGLVQGSFREVASFEDSSMPPPDSLRKSGSFKGAHSSLSSVGGGLGFRQAKSRGALEPASPVNEEEKAAMVQAELNRALRKRRPWHLWTSTWLVMFAIVIALCVVSTVLATRDFGHLISLAPIVQVAGERLMLVKTAATFSRELVLDDYLSRMSKQELSDGLLFVIEQIRHTDRLIRLGNSPEEGIAVGADERNEKHNAVMYGAECPWMDPAWLAVHEEVTGTPSGGHRRIKGSAAAEAKLPWRCFDPAKPSVGSGGLLSVLVAYENALESILYRYGLPADRERGKELFHYVEHPLQELEERAHFATDYKVHLRLDRLDKLVTDDDVAYVLASTDGYLAQGLTYVMELFDHELGVLLEEAVSLNEILFSVYIVTVIVAFWYFLFNWSMSHAAREAENAKDLVIKIPLYVLTQEEIEGIADFFKDQEEDDHEDLDRTGSA